MSCEDSGNNLSWLNREGKLEPKEILVVVRRVQRIPENVALSPYICCLKGRQFNGNHTSNDGDG